MIPRTFKPPIFADEEQTRVAYLLYLILLTLSALNIADMILLAIFAPETWPTFWINGLLMAVLLLCYWLMWQGKVYTSSLIFGLSFWLLLMYYLSISGGVMSPAFGLLAILIICAAVLLGVRGAIGIGALCIASGVALFWAGEHRLLVNMEALPTPARLFATQTIIFAALLGLTAISGKSIFSALTRARNGERALAERNQQLQQEIIERERAQREQARLSSIVEVTSDLVGIASAQGNVIYLNPAGRKLMGFAEGADTAGTTIADYHPPEIAQMVLNEAVPEAAREGTWFGETIVRTRAGLDIPCSQVIIAHRDKAGTVDFYSTIARDLSPHKQAEQNRFEMTWQKERAELFRGFLDNISHDLKTPLSVIETCLHVLKRSSEPGQQQKQLEILHQQTELLARYIQNLLTLSQLHNIPEFVMAPVDINSLINDVLLNFASIAEGQNLTLQAKLAATLPPISADVQELNRAFVHLVENAVHYTPSGGLVSIQTALQDSLLVIEITDTGIGIAPIDLPQIFDRFYRANQARQMRSGGTGLRLAIVKRIIELHGGKIEVESRLGAGTTFRISLPITPDHANIGDEAKA